MKTPVNDFKKRIMFAVREFEKESGRTVKGIGLVRLDQPVIFEGDETDLVNIEVKIRG